MLVTLLTVLFVGLKLTGMIAWSWWLVFSPVLASFALFLITLVGGLLMIHKLERIADLG